MTAGATLPTSTPAARRRARNYCPIVLLGTIVSVANHCLPGDDAPAASPPAVNQR